MIDKDLFDFLCSQLDDEKEKKILTLIISGNSENEEIIRKLIEENEGGENDQV